MAFPNESDWQLQPSWMSVAVVSVVLLIGFVGLYWLYELGNNQQPLWQEYLDRLLREEEEEIRRDPEGERREIVELYRARGYTDDEITIIANRLMSNPKLLLEDMAHKELGIAPGSKEEPVGNAIVMGIAYVAGGVVPVLPYLLLPIATALPVSVLAAFITLFLFGGLKGRLVAQSWWRSGLEMLLVAGGAALAGYVVGQLAGRFVQS